jgi:hypothetical protein
MDRLRLAVLISTRELVHLRQLHEFICELPVQLYYSNYYSNYYGPYRTTTSISQGGHFADTLFVPEIYTGLALRWTYAELGVKFEVQKWQSDNDNYSFQSPTIVGIGGTLTARY